MVGADSRDAHSPPGSSGLGDETYVPPWLYSNPPHYDMEHARREFEICCFSAVEDLLNKTGVTPKQARVGVRGNGAELGTAVVSAQQACGPAAAAR